MFKQKISISINSYLDRKEIEESFSLLMSLFSRTGQIMGDGEMSFIIDKTLIAYQTSLEADSLSEQYQDENIKSIQKLEYLC